MTYDENLKKLNSIVESSGLSKKSQIEFLNIIMPIFNHDEFQKRMSKDFPHHGNTPLGIHILKDAMLTYVMAKKHKKKNINGDFSVEVAVKIAMMHDLYELPWQNNPLSKAKKIKNKHGFRHPIEAAINAIKWFPDEFKDETISKKIIDGIIHHMWPLPVVSFEDSEKNELELKNFDKLKDISKIHLDIINWSTTRGKVGGFSVSKSLYKEGKIMSKADKKSSIKQFDNFSDFTALLSGNNRRLDNKRSIKKRGK